MKKSTPLLCAMIVAMAAAVAGAKPIDYTVTGPKSIMTIAMRGDVEWRVEKNGSLVKVLLAGDAKNFIVKRINYNFRDGAIKSFSMAPSHPDTEQIAITLRNDQQYTIFQHPSSKRLSIEFFTSSHAVAVPAKKKSVSPPVSAPIDIAHLAKSEGLGISEQAPASSGVHQAPVKENAGGGIAGSALLLLLASVLILVGGTAALAYVVMRKRSAGISAPETQRAAPVLRTDLRAPAVHEPQEESDPDFDRAIEYAEQYLRTQGEYELQQRLEQLTAASFHTRIEKEIVKKRSKTTNSAAAAQKLGISVGELELATRLKRLQNQQTREAI